MNTEFEYPAEDLSNTVEPIAGADTEEIRVRAAAHRKREREQLGLNLENSEHTNPNLKKDKESFDTDKAHQQKILTQLESHYHIAGSAYYFKDQPNKLAFKATQHKIMTGNNDERVSLGMVMLAEARDWKTLKVSGHPDFCRQIWLEASSRHIQVQGYIPQEHDLQKLDKRLEQTLKNQIESIAPAHSLERQPASTPPPSSPLQNQETKQDSTQQVYEGCLLEHQSAPYDFNPSNPKNYYAKLATNQGEKIIWGIDLQRAISESKVAIGDTIKLYALGKQPVTVKVKERDPQGNVIGEHEIDTHRNAWDAQKTDQYKVLNTVAAALIKSKVHDPIMQQALIANVQEKILKQAEKGNLPNINLYDKNAESIKKDYEKNVPFKEHPIEKIL